MKTLSFVGVAAILVLSGCGSPSTTTTSTSTTSTAIPITNGAAAGSDVINATTGAVNIGIGGGDILDPATGQISVPVGGDLYLNPATGQVTTYFPAAIQGQIKDVDLQIAQLQSATIQARADSLSQEFGMSVSSAVQVTQLADRMSALTAGGQQMTPQDEAALLDAAYGVAGVTGAQVNAAAQAWIQTGDQTAVNALLNQAAAYMGMSSAAALRYEILPSLGINLNAQPAAAAK